MIVFLILIYFSFEEYCVLAVKEFKRSNVLKSHLHTTYFNACGKGMFLQAIDILKQTVQDNPKYISTNQGKNEMQS